MRTRCTNSSQQGGSSGSFEIGFVALIAAAICSTLVAVSLAFCLEASGASLCSGTSVLSDVGQVTSNPSFKGDRLISARAKAEDDVKVSRSSAASRSTKIPVGCERAFSALAKLNHADVAVRCLTSIDPASKLG
jgi:hypothetical protein